MKHQNISNNIIVPYLYTHSSMNSQVYQIAIEKMKII
jgi:hypothetical protein